MGNLCPSPLACAHGSGLELGAGATGRLHDPHWAAWAWTPSWKQECQQGGDSWSPMALHAVPPGSALLQPNQSGTHMGPLRNQSPPQGSQGWCCAPATQGRTGLTGLEPSTLVPQALLCAAESRGVCLGSSLLKASFQGSPQHSQQA